MSFNVVIPARYASSRLPGKALLDYDGKPIVQHVYDNACASGASEVVIATDDLRIKSAATEFKAEVMLTSNKHKSGTDRIAEVTKLKKWTEETVIVNVQGDEPQMPAENIKQVAENIFKHPDVSMSTLCSPIVKDKDYQDHNVVKVIFDKQNLAQNFSRKVEKLNCKNPVTDLSMVYRHLGIYAYKVGFLDIFTKMTPSSFEIKESLEQLRALQNGHKIYVDVCKQPAGIGVDTAEDYEMLKNS